MAKNRVTYHHGDLRRALLDATVHLAGELGAAGVTLRAAARVAGVSQTAPYRHIADKTAMLAAASEEGHLLLAESLETAAAIADPARRILALCVCYVEFAITHADRFRLMFGQGSPPKAAAAALQARARHVFQLLLTAVQQWLAGRRRLDPRATMFKLWALAHGVATLTIERQIGFEPDNAAAIAHSGLEALMAGLIS
jgi:AcrR family transcriptional regulator